MVTLLQSFPLEVLPNGDNEIRTRDSLLARQVLSQLSYTPKGDYYSLYGVARLEGKFLQN